MFPILDKCGLENQNLLLFIKMIELRRELFENSVFMQKFKETKFLLILINIVQCTIVLLLIGLLFLVSRQTKKVSVLSVEKVQEVVAEVEEVIQEDWMKFLLGSVMLIKLAKILTVFHRGAYMQFKYIFRQNYMIEVAPIILRV